MKQKVLILYNQLFHYRIPIFNILAEEYDLTVLYSKEASIDILSKCNFKTTYSPAKKIWKFYYHEESIFKYCNDFDIIVAYGDISWLKFSTLGFNSKRNFKLIYWSIGVSASYNRRFDDGNKFIDFIKDIFFKKADAQVFYTDYPIKKHISRGFNPSSLFVAPNTVEVLKISLSSNLKKDILFIGTLYLEKGILVLLENYRQAYLINNNIPNLKIVGDGPEKNKIKDWIEKNKLDHKIFLLGPVYDSATKLEIFQTCIACISPNQAGLSVLESMGYGVPYITHENAITGGESLNIINNNNGIRFKDMEDLKLIILDTIENKEKFLEMGKNSYNYYWELRKPIDMAQGIINAVKFVSKR